jgi:catechol 2,3-dioxygenase-like lactoylglutathione lyase family enzyme
MQNVICLIFCSLVSLSVSAQLNLADGNPVVYGHHHVNATDVQAHTRFWVEGLGGSIKQIGVANREIIAFPNVLVFLTERQPTGGTRGSVVNHVGFETTDINKAVSHLLNMGYAMITASELPASYTVLNGIGKRDGANTIAYVQGPDDIKVELIENKANTDSIQLHHIHWAAADGDAMRAWYGEHFLATPGSRIGQPAADLPGINLTFAPDTTELAPTRGRVLDHIGFEIADLEAFCQTLEAKGIVFDVPYQKVPSLGIAVAFFTDPWGTYIELTEGLDQIE